MAHSFQLFVRATIMIVCLVAIPLIALFGKQIPEFFEAIWNGQARVTSWQTRPTDPKAATLAPSPMNERFASQQSRADLDEAPKFQAGDAPPPGFKAMPRADEIARNAPPRMLPPDVLKAAEPLPLPSGGRVARNPSTLMPNTAAMNNTPPISDPFVRPTVGIDAAANGSATSVAPAEDPLAVAQKQLQALGVTYFKLETTGESSIRYRCYCQVRHGNGPAQEFFGVHAVPLNAVQDVKGQIERWQATLNERAGQGATKLR